MILTSELTGTVSWNTTVLTGPRSRRRHPSVRAWSEPWRTARRMHDAGINHRDFYICHFHLDELSLQEQETRCYLIDLHRAQIRERTPRRWRIRTLPGCISLPWIAAWAGATCGALCGITAPAACARRWSRPAAVAAGGAAGSQVVPQGTRAEPPR